MRKPATAWVVQDPPRLQRHRVARSGGACKRDLYGERRKLRPWDAAAAKTLGHAITVYVPDNAAKKKLDALTELGATIKPLPFNQWWQVMTDHGHPDEPGVFLHPVADTAVLAGDATIGLEIMQDLPDADAILVPFGGGGLISGISAAAKAIRPEVRAIGCESTAATPLAAALTANTPVEVPFDQSTFINGIGSTRVLDEMWPLLRRLVDGAISVTPSDAQDAMRVLHQETGQIAEGAGAVPLAAALSERVQTGKIVCVISGGNIDAAIAEEFLNG